MITKEKDSGLTPFGPAENMYGFSPYSQKIPTLAELDMPEYLENFARLKSGFFWLSVRRDTASQPLWLH